MFFELSLDAQPLGNVKLECDPAPAIAGSVGYITVYQPDLGAYVPVCQSGVNRAAAAAVCRQLGFVDAKPFTTGDYVTPPSNYYKYVCLMYSCKLLRNMQDMLYCS